MLLGFKPRFVEPIQNRTKIFTMRKHRKIRPKIGETLHMYTGLRTKHCKKISDKEKLMGVQCVTLRINLEKLEKPIWIRIDGRILTNEEISVFVRWDGFKDEADFISYWLFEGDFYLFCWLELFHWTDLKY